jgi:hypothetical protein
MTKEEGELLSNKIKKGLELSFKRLVEKTKKENGRLVFSKDGKIFYVQASDLK